MKIDGYVICQAVKKELQGIKGAEVGGVGYIFDTKEEAYKFLSEVIEMIKGEMKIGKRQKNSLNPDEWLDFSVEKVTTKIGNSKMHKKGWKWEGKEIPLDT